MRRELFQIDRVGLVAQICLASFLVITVTLMPPRRGSMVVIPLSDDPVKPWLDAQKGVTILGLGRLPGSIIVDADRNVLLPAAMAHYAVLLPVLPALCDQN